MKHQGPPAANVDEIMGRIRAEISGHPYDSAHVVPANATQRHRQRSLSLDVTPVRLPPYDDRPPFSVRSSRRYHVNDFVSHDDADLVRHAWIALLGRAPTPQEISTKVDALRYRGVTPLALLANLHESPEGKRYGAQLDGLWRYRLETVCGRLPVIGRVLQIGLAILTLPTKIGALRLADTSAARRVSSLRDRTEALRGELERGVNTLTKIVSVLDERLSELEQDHDRLAAAGGADRPDDARPRDDRRAPDTARGSIESSIETFRVELLDLQRRVHLVTRRLRDAPPTASKPGTLPPGLDSITIAALEGQIRGTREEIKRRLRGFLAHLPPQTGDDAGPSVLDLGCGAGEWLEVLRDAGIPAIGVDENVSVVERCRELGLDVEKNDALLFLRRFTDASANGVTAFHLVEHLPMEDTLALIDEAYRVLRTGGVLIVESPNPQNIVVGACTFYLDPSHVKPLHPNIVRAILEDRGFDEVVTLPLNPETDPTFADVLGRDTRLAEMFTGPREFAVVGKKP